MRVRFWGTRGSLPVALTAEEVQRKLVRALLYASGRHFQNEAQAQDFIREELDFASSHTFGGNSSCVEIVPGGSEYVLCDLGSGVRPFANRVLAKHGPAHSNVFHVFVSHMHWDHIMGFPFFTPAYIPGNRIVIYGGHAELEDALRRQQDAPSFPVRFDQLQADIEFVRLAPGRSHNIAGMRVTPKLQLHAGDSYGYRFEKDGKAVVYSTDSEHKLEDAASTAEFVAFFADADLVIFDAMYSLADAISVKEDWGHSSNIVGVELCQMARARHLVMFHHEPVFSDERIAEILEETRRFEEITRGEHQLRVSTAYDGMEIAL